jgi:hypothetical protein
MWWFGCVPPALLAGDWSLGQENPGLAAVLDKPKLIVIPRSRATRNLIRINQGDINIKRMRFLASGSE